MFGDNKWISSEILAKTLIEFKIAVEHESINSVVLPVTIWPSGNSNAITAGISVTSECSLIFSAYLRAGATGTLSSFFNSTSSIINFI